MAVGRTREDAAAVFGSWAGDLFLTSYSDLVAEVDLAGVAVLLLADGDGMKAALSDACARLAAGAGPSTIAVEYVAGRGDGAIRDAVAAYPEVILDGVQQINHHVVLVFTDGSGTTADALALATAAVDSATVANRADRDPVVGDNPAAVAPPDEVTTLAGQILQRSAGVLGGRARTTVGLAFGLVIVALVLWGIGGRSAASAGVIIAVVVVVALGQRAALVSMRRSVDEIGARLDRQRALLRRTQELVDRRTRRILRQGRAHASSLGNVAQLRRYVEELAAAHSRSDALARERSALSLAAQERGQLDTQRQLQAAFNLFGLLDLSGAVPPMGGRAASPEMVLLGVETLLGERPVTVVECGSGVSTLAFALAVAQYDLETRIVALEHDERHRESTMALLKRHGVADRAEVRLAPLVLTPGDDDDSAPWYAESSVADLGEIGLVLVSGPREMMGEPARLPAVHLLTSRFAPRCTILVSDVARDPDDAVADEWHEHLPDFTREPRDDYHRSLGIFRRG